MQTYTTSQLSIITAVPTVTVLLLWTLAIFYKNRKKWRPYDIAIVAILIQSVLRNISTLLYTIIYINNSEELPKEYCTAAIWLFNSIHTFQASTLSTLSVIGLFVMRLYKKHKPIKQYLTTSHIAYHMFCLTTLCACVGVAATLARNNHSVRKSASFEFNFGRNSSYGEFQVQEGCQFMPYNLDIKYNIFILSLHTLLAFISTICFVGLIFVYYRFKQTGFNYLKKSTSDLSDLSLGAAASTVGPKDDGHPKNYYDTYQKPQDAAYIKQDGYANAVFGGGTKQEPWNSDTSNISTSVSSTNSRRPCLPKQTKDENDPGLETIVPVLIVCYLFNHLPVVVLCVFPWLIHPWSVPGAVLWLGLIQDALLPTGMALVDRRFNTWVSTVYRCSNRHRSTADKLPHGLDGKFRPFSTQHSVEAPPQTGQSRTRQIAPPSQIIGPDHKFPITNGSLYTSIDGRLPIIHNYRRHNGMRSPVNSISMGLHSTYIKRQESILNPPLQHANLFQSPDPCDDSFISLPADYTSISSSYADIKSNRTNSSKKNNSKPQLNQSRVSLAQKPTNNPAYRIFSASQNSLSDISIIENELRKTRLGNLSKSQSNLNEINVTQRDIQKFRINPEMYQKQNLNLSKMHNDREVESSDDEYCDQSLNSMQDYKNFDTISTQSCCSITTEANCDFEFFSQQKCIPSNDHDYQNNNNNTIDSQDNGSYMICLKQNDQMNSKKSAVMKSFHPLSSKDSPELNNKYNNYTQVNDLSRNNSPKNKFQHEPGLNFRITRSNSKRSLENLDAYIIDNDDDDFSINRNYNMRQNVTRSNSNKSYEILRSFPNMGDVNYIQKPNVNRLKCNNLNMSCIQLGDLERSEAYNRVNLARRNYKFDNHKEVIPILSMESLNSMLSSHKGISYLDNGDICNHNYGGSVPDLKKIFVTEFL